MKIKKVKYDGLDSFNDYQVELSYGQLVAIRNALEKSHDDPLSDELHAELNYYLQNIPGPGEKSDEFKAERDATKKTQDEAGQEVNPEDAPSGPPNETELEAGDGSGGPLPAPPSSDEEMPGGPGRPEGPPGQDQGGFKEGPKLSQDERDIIDRSLRGGPSARPTGIKYGNAPRPSVPRPPVD